MIELGTHLGTSLGTSLGSDSSDELTFVTQFLQRNLFSWFSKYGRVEASGRVVRFDDMVTLAGAVRPNAKSVDANHAFTQAVDDATNRVAAGGAVFTGTQSYSSSIDKANWRIAHNGVSLMCLARVKPTPGAFEANAVFASTKVLDAGGAGTFMFRNLGTSQIFLLTDDGTTFLANPAFGVVADNVAALLDAQIKVSDTPDYVYRLNGNIEETGDLGTATPASVDPVHTMRIGFDGTSGHEVYGEIDEIMWASAVDPAIRTAAERYFALRYA